jgi:hypothetical protein
MLKLNNVTDTPNVQYKWNTMEEVYSFFQKQKIDDAHRPQDIKGDELTNMSAQEYAARYSAWLGWFNYVNRIMADVKSYHLEVVNEQKDIEVNIRITMKKVPGKKPSLKDIDDHVWVQPRYNELQVIRQKYEQIMLVLSAEIDRAEKNVRMISRQIELRKTDFEGTVSRLNS